jgi:outer membrane receptor protein involved in Fe transport
VQDQIKLGRLSFQLGGRQDFVTTQVDNGIANTTVATDASAFTGRAADALLAYSRDNWRLALNVTNLADTRYVAACDRLSGCFYAEGRKAIARLTYHW